MKLSRTTLRRWTRKNCPRAERGKLFAEFLVGTIDSLERSTTRKLVVSALGRAGLFYNMLDPHQTRIRVTNVDPTKARPHVNGTDLFARRISVERSAPGYIKITNGNSNTQSAMPASGVPSQPNAGDWHAPRQQQRHSMHQTHSQKFQNPFDCSGAPSGPSCQPTRSASLSTTRSASRQNKKSCRSFGCSSSSHRSFFGS